MGGIIFLFLFVLVLITIVVLIVKTEKKRNEKLKILSGVFQGKVGSGLFGNTFEGNYQGMKFLVLLAPESKNSPRSLHITLFKNCYITFKVSYESFFTNLGKKLGFIHEVNINDPRFDKVFFISSKVPEAASGHLNNENVKFTIGGLFIDGFDSLSIDEKKVFIKKENYDLEKDLSPDYIKGILQKLNSIAK